MGEAVNAVALVLIDSQMGKPLMDAGVAARISVGRDEIRDEIAQIVMMLVDNAHMTGQTIAVNGGALFILREKASAKAAFLGQRRLSFLTELGEYPLLGSSRAPSRLHNGPAFCVNAGPAVNHMAK
jgi:hypothetical protein